MRLVVGLVLVSACSGSKAIDAAAPPPLDAMVVTSPPDAAIPMTVPLARGTATLGDLTIELISNGGGSGPGVSMAEWTLTVRRGSDEVNVGLSETVGSGFGDHDLDAEFVAFDRLLVIDASDAGQTITLMPGRAPVPIDEAEGRALIDAEAARQGRARFVAKPAPFTRSFGNPHNDGVFIHVERDGERTLWTGQVGLFTRRVSLSPR